VLIRIIDEFKALKEVLNEQALKMQESDLVDKKLEFFREECRLLNDMIQEYQKENKELKAKLLSLEQDLLCNEQALIKKQTEKVNRPRALSIAREVPYWLDPRHLVLCPCHVSRNSHLAPSTNE
jgi:small-conductance mechanosensitive channel